MPVTDLSKSKSQTPIKTSQLIKTSVKQQGHESSQGNPLRLLEAPGATRLLCDQVSVSADTVEDLHADNLAQARVWARVDIRMYMDCSMLNDGQCG